jgi:hypothetical protein
LGDEGDGNALGKGKRRDLFFLFAQCPIPKFFVFLLAVLAKVKGKRESFLVFTFLFLSCCE